MTALIAGSIKRVAQEDILGIDEWPRLTAPELITIEFKVVTNVTNGQLATYTAQTISLNLQLSTANRYDILLARDIELAYEMDRYRREYPLPGLIRGRSHGGD